MVDARRERLRAVLVAVVLATTAACSGGGADPFATATTTTSGGTTPIDTVPVSTTAPGAATTSPLATNAVTTSAPAITAVDRGELGGLDAALAPDGAVDLDAALGLVAAGYEPLPGVTAAVAPLVDGGPALRTVMASFDDLTAEQQTAVAEIAAPVGTPLAAASTSSSPLTVAAAAAVDRSLATFGWSADDLPIAILELPRDGDDGTHAFSSAAALATGLVVRDDETTECRIRVDTAATPSDPSFLAAVARETFHCGQYLRDDVGADVPAWVVEGAAAYAADRVAGPTPLTAAAWDRWVGEPQRALMARTSDAIGFFALVGDSADPFAFAAALLGDPSVASVRRRLEPSDLFDRWGREYATQPDWEGGFAFTAPGAAGRSAPRTPVALTLDGAPVAIGGRAELSATTYDVEAPGDVLVITTSPGDRGVVRFANGQHVALAQATQSACLLAGGCGCPGVPADALNIGEAGGPAVFIGVGPSSGPGPTMAARSLARWCQEVAVPPPADAVDPCLVGAWRTTAYVAPETSGVVQTVSGGAGATVTFGADRTVRVDMSTASPVVIEATGTTGASSRTTLTYRGTGAGTWRADGGVVEIAGVDPATFGIRVHVESAEGAPLGDADLPATDVRGAIYATVLGTARYACTPVSLSLTHVLPGVGAAGGFDLSPS